MTEPSERDLEMAREFILAGHSPIYEDQIASLLAAARAEERERIVKLAQEYAELWEIAVAPLVDRIRSGQ